MILSLYKADVTLSAVLLSLALSPTPYTINDCGDRVTIEIRDDIGPKRIYDLGGLMVVLRKAIIAISFEHAPPSSPFHAQHSGEEPITDDNL